MTINHRCTGHCFLWVFIVGKRPCLRIMSCCYELRLCVRLVVEDNSDGNPQIRMLTKMRTKSEHLSNPLFSRDEATLYERLSVRPSVGWLVGWLRFRFFGLLGATNAVYTAPLLLFRIKTNFFSKISISFVLMINMQLTKQCNRQYVSFNRDIPVHHLKT